MSATTVYVGPFTRTNPATGRESSVEFRLEDSEAYPELLDIGTYGYSSGNEFNTCTLNEKQVTELRDALTTWLEADRG